MATQTNNPVAQATAQPPAAVPSKAGEQPPVQPVVQGSGQAQPLVPQQTPDPKAGQGEAAKGGEQPPEEISLKLPEGVKANEKMLEGFKALAKEHGYSAKQAQAAADFYFGVQQQEAKNAEAALKAYVAKCESDLKADAEFGGANYEANMEVAKQALVKFGSPDLAKELVGFGLGSHPGLMKFLLKIGNATREDRTVSSTRIAPATKTEDESLRLRYDKTPQMFPQGQG